MSDDMSELQAPASAGASLADCTSPSGDRQMGTDHERKREREHAPGIPRTNIRARHAGSADNPRRSRSGATLPCNPNHAARGITLA